MALAYASWPILQLGPGRAQFFDQDLVLEYSGPISAPAREPLLEACEAALISAPARSIKKYPGLYWNPADEGLREFLSNCRQRIGLAGGLRCFSREALPVEALRCGGDWSAAFPMFRMHPIDAGLESRPVLAESASPVPENSPPEDGGSLRKLVWFNPAGEPELPAARAEAEAVFAMLEQAPGPSRFVARELTDHEWYELYDSHDVVFYYGHGQSVGGHPAILTRNGRAPFFAPVPAAVGPEVSTRRCLVFAACLAGGGEVVFRNRNGAVIYPICRLADRPSRFLLDFCQAFLSEKSIPDAMFAASRLDAIGGDMRRFVFRLQGAD